MSVVIQTMREHKKQVDALSFDLLDDWVRQVPRLALREIAKRPKTPATHHITP